MVRLQRQPQPVPVPVPKSGSRILAFAAFRTVRAAARDAKPTGRP
jgi:hypothetical protein